MGIRNQPELHRLEPPWLKSLALLNTLLIQTMYSCRLVAPALSTMQLA